MFSFDNDKLQLILLVPFFALNFENSFKLIKVRFLLVLRNIETRKFIFRQVWLRGTPVQSPETEVL